ncbi:hypothetical protein B1179_00600, partial [Enterococcus faecium]
YDIAFCVRSIREDIGEEQYVELFFDLLGIKPDWEKIKYYILLDELFSGSLSNDVGKEKS